MEPDLGQSRGDDLRPIAMFDSGFGGLTVARAVIDLLPREHLVYLGDTGRYPYGPRPPDEVRRFAHQITDELLEHDPKALVVACNTAAAAALDELADRVDIPVIGVIEPGVRSLVQATRNGRVGRDRHRRDHQLGRVPAGRWPTVAPQLGPHRAGVPGPRRVRRAGRDLRPSRCTCWPSACWPRRSTPTSTPCCWGARTTRTWPGRSVT